MEQILLWIRLIYPWLFLKRKTGWGSWGRWELPFGMCLCWHLWSIQARGYVCEVEIPNKQGQRRAIPGAEQRVHHSTEANPTQPRYSACTQSALEKQGILGWQFENTLSLRGDAIQQVFVQSLQTDTVLHIPLSGRIQAWSTKRQQLQRLFLQYNNSHQKLTLPFLFLQNHKALISGNSSIYLFWKDFS